MENLIVFVFRHFVKLFLAWLVLSVVASFVIGRFIRAGSGEE